MRPKQLILSLLAVAALGGAAGASAHSSGRTNASFAQVKSWARHYYSTHSGRNRDINAKTSSQLASDPAARRLISTCGKNERPVFPILAWEYGGSDHPWIHPGASALVYCVFIPVRRNTAHWRYNRSKGRVTADVYVRFPGRNPCRHKAGSRQVTDCLGDPSNIEILVDTASLHDGADAGYDLSEASTTLLLIKPNGHRVQLVTEQ
ncbi:MAG: hypothetical protein ACJ764_06150 [Solirubrobacteraceae bacterium]